MNKDEFNTFLQTNLDHYDQFILEGVDFFTNKYSGDSEKAKNRITSIWNEHLNTIYAVARANILKEPTQGISWDDYIASNNILDQIDNSLINVDFSDFDDENHLYNKFDEKGHRVTTYEGFTGYIAEDMKEYFYEMYLKQDWNVVPGHWPSMETERDVDEWIDSMNDFFDSLEKKIKNKTL